MTDTTRYTEEQLQAAEARLLGMMATGMSPDDGVAELSDEDLLIEREAIARLLARMEPSDG